jgi:ABC-type transport system substrate-binding protein
LKRASWTCKPWWINWGGELATFEKIDDYTFSVTFAQSFPTFPVTLASSTVSGYLQGGRTGGGMYAPQHYLEQFLPDVAGQEEVDAMAQEAGFETWNLFFLAKAVATTGASGGNEQTGLYFEMRHLGRAFDPLRWVKSQ